MDTPYRVVEISNAIVRATMASETVRKWEMLIGTGLARNVMW
jgi:hypothetical protein